MLRPLIRTAAFTLALLFTFGPIPDACAGGDWNDAGMSWLGYEEGLAQAKTSGKPVCLIFYTDWCPHCTKYSAVFHDEKVVAESKKFVMIRLNKEEHAETSTKYAPDGQYIPRTYFLAPDGTLDPEIHEQRETYKYFYNTAVAAGLLRGMQEALDKFGAKPTKGAGS